VVRALLHHQQPCAEPGDRRRRSQLAQVRILALQLHSGQPARIEIRDIRIRELLKRRRSRLAARDDCAQSLSAADDSFLFRGLGKTRHYRAVGQAVPD